MTVDSRDSRTIGPGHEGLKIMKVEMSWVALNILLFLPRPVVRNRDATSTSSLQFIVSLPTFDVQYTSTRKCESPKVGEDSNEYVHICATLEGVCIRYHTSWRVKPRLVRLEFYLHLNFVPYMHTLGQQIITSLDCLSLRGLMIIKSRHEI